MAFNIVVILLVALIAYWHYVQGFFSAAISAFCAVIAAVLAVSYHETVVNALLKGKMADYAHAMVLAIIFAIVYIVLRTIFDFAIPGNVRTPSVVDKIGSALMGIVAGIFAVGTFAIAVQMLPFDPGLSVMGYARYELAAQRSATVPRPGTFGLDAKVNDELVIDSFPAEPSDTDKVTHLWLPVDDLVLNTCYMLSKPGSMGGSMNGGFFDHSDDRPLASIHPDYLHELFAERLGIQTGGSRVAMPIGSDDPIEIKGIYSFPSLAAADGQVKDLRTSGYHPAYKNELKPGPGQSILVIRMSPKTIAVDADDHLFRFSCGSIRLVGPTGDDSNKAYKDFHPIGTVEWPTPHFNKLVLLNKPDDFLFVKENDDFDAVFLIDSSLIEGGGKGGGKLKAGTFVSVKRMAMNDLSGETIKTTMPYDSSSHVQRSKVLIDTLKLPPRPTEEEKDKTASVALDLGFATCYPPDGWVSVAPKDSTDKGEFVPSGMTTKTADRWIVMGEAPPGKPEDLAKALLTKSGKVASEPATVAGATGVSFTNNAQDAANPRFGIIVEHNSRNYFIFAVSNGGTDSTDKVYELINTWKWGTAAPTDQTPAPGGSDTPTPPPAPTPADNPTPTTPIPPAADNTKLMVNAEAANQIKCTGSVQLGTAVADQDAKDAAVSGGGTMTLAGGQIKEAKVDPTASITQLGQGATQSNTFICPSEFTVVQVEVSAANWDWLSQISTATLVDTDKNTFTAAGVYGLAKNADSSGLFLRYNSNGKLGSITAPDGAPVGSSYIIFLVRSGSTIKTFKIGDRTEDLSSPLKAE